MEAEVGVASFWCCTWPSAHRETTYKTRVSGSIPCKPVTRLLTFTFAFIRGEVAKGGHLTWTFRRAACFFFALATAFCGH